eukprot:365265-Chlamydomonas_euryale.AAC.9
MAAPAWLHPHGCTRMAAPICINCTEQSQLQRAIRPKADACASALSCAGTHTFASNTRRPAPGIPDQASHTWLFTPSCAASSAASGSVANWAAIGLTWSCACAFGERFGEGLTMRE